MFRSFASCRLLTSAVFAVLAGVCPLPVRAASLMHMTFDNGGADIDEATGWDGTTAPGGSLAAGLAVTSGMKIFGDFTGQNAGDGFHVDDWQPNNAPGTRVSITIGALPYYSFSLSGGAFSTIVSQHPSNGTDVFDSVTLTINGVVIGLQSYIPAGGAQLLSWSIAADPQLDNLTAASIDLTFTGAVIPNPGNHGPEWTAIDSSYVSLEGTVAPEPTTAILALTGLALATVSRRRKE